MKVELIPVLEISVTIEVLAKVGAHPPGSFQNKPNDWDAYQQKLSELSGLSRHDRIPKGNNLVRVTELSVDELRIIINSHLAVYDGQLPVSESCPLFGGCVLVIDNVPVLGPQCCGTIADFYSWQKIISTDFASGPFCMEGHPCPVAIRKNNKITILCEEKYEEFTYPAQSVIVVQLPELFEAVKQAASDVDKLADAIDKLSTEFNVPKLSNYLVK